jgi:hypothetical protein
LLFESRTGARAAARQRKQDGWTMLDMVGAMVSIAQKVWEQRPRTNRKVVSRVFLRIWILPDTAKI